MVKLARTGAQAAHRAASGERVGSPLVKAPARRPAGGKLLLECITRPRPCDGLVPESLLKNLVVEKIKEDSVSSLELVCCFAGLARDTHAGKGPLAL